MKQYIHMAVLPRCDYCDVSAMFDAPTHTSGNFRKYLCRTHYLKLANKEQPASILKLTHKVQVDVD